MRCYAIVLELSEGGKNSKSEEKICRKEKNAYLCNRILAMGRFQSGQMGQTVNLLRHRFGGSNPSLPTDKMTPES